METLVPFNVVGRPFVVSCNTAFVLGAVRPVPWITINELGETPEFGETTGG